RNVTCNKFFNNVNTSSPSPVRKSATQSGCLHFLRGALAVVAGLRAVHNATTSILRSTDRTLTSVTGSLLLVGLASTTRNFAASLGRVSSLTGSCQLSNNNLVNQRNVSVHIEHLGGEFSGARLLTFDIE